MRLTINNLSKKYKNKVILENINISVSSGEILAVVGRNGSGKTTLLQSIVGILNIDSGDITVDNDSLLSNPNIKKEIFFVPDRFDYFKYTKIQKVVEYYKIIYKNFDKNFFSEELKKNNININKRCSQLSKGELMIFSIILALASNTKFLLLDEPLDGIDFVNINVILEYILDAQERGIGLIICSHQLNYLEKISNSVYFLGAENKQYKSEIIDKENYVKYQIVCADNTNIELLNNEDVLVVSNVGRIITIITKYSVDFEENLKKSKIIQYDKLNASIEEIFMFKNK